MKLLVTAGGTSERIDAVRSITNHSTGALGCLIAQHALQTNAIIDYVTTKQALQPSQHPNLTIHEIEGTDALKQTIERLLTEETYDAVIHSMAVSDFTPSQTFSQVEFLAKINHLIQTGETLAIEDLAAAFQSETIRESKISSNTDALYMVLKKTPKIIQTIKEIQPNTLLIGFKLLIDVSKETLIDVAYQSLLHSQADFVFANDLSTIRDGQHLGYLIGTTGEILATAQTKQEIALLLIQTIKNQLSKKE